MATTSGIGLSREISLGIALAALDLAAAERRNLPKAEHQTLTTAKERLQAARALVLTAARAVDHDPDQAVLPSAAKVRVAMLAGELTLLAARLLGRRASGASVAG